MLMLLSFQVWTLLDSKPQDVPNIRKCREALPPGVLMAEGSQALLWGQD